MYGTINIKFIAAFRTRQISGVDVKIRISTKPLPAGISNTTHIRTHARLSFLPNQNDPNNGFIPCIKISSNCSLRWTNSTLRFLTFPHTTVTHHQISTKAHTAFVSSAAFFMSSWLFTCRCWQSPAVTILIGPSLFGDPLAGESNHRSENLARTTQQTDVTKTSWTEDGRNPSACALPRIKTRETSKTLMYNSTHIQKVKVKATFSSEGSTVPPILNIGTHRPFYTRKRAPVHIKSVSG
jgi:hypothetical protein